MWDENNSTFQEIEDDGLDIDSIFGGSGNAEDPFANMTAPAAPNVTAIPQKTETEAPQKPTKVASIKTTAPKVAKAPSTVEDEEAPNPIEAAITAQTEKSLFEKPAVFAYGSAKEDIQDGSMTFEELRIAKLEEFPELEDGKKVTWIVEYGKTTKTVADPKGTTIISMKEEIERSKAFLDSLKKAKDKNPSCLIKPTVFFKSKGQSAVLPTVKSYPSYKGMFSTQVEAEASDKVICLFPAQDGRVYELRKTEMGDFISPKTKVIELPVARAGFTPALPLIPMDILATAISFFRSFMNQEEEYEALAHIYWDKELEEYFLHVPKQIVSKTRITADLTDENFPEERYLRYADIHSHNSMPAKFSKVDNADEKATGLYFVVGRLDKFLPDITARISVGGIFHKIDVATVIEESICPFPSEWAKRVTIKKKQPKSSDYAAKLLELTEAL